MSLFKSREWWAVSLNENELYDSQCLLIMTLGDDKFESILLGNHKGVLRLFSPNSELDGKVLSYKPSHLLLEVQLGSPILQISEGNLVSGSIHRHLAVLHPRLFSVYTLKRKESKETTIGDQMEIELAYQHVLRHSAYSFVLGPFGGVRGRHFVCIQSLDGLLSFYEQESFAFQLYLPTFLLPSTFSYLEKSDSFLFLNGLLIMDCYSYESLASAANSNDKKILKTWEYNIGENIIDINTVPKNGLVIVILSERNYYGLNDKGKMIFIRRLESKPVAFCSYLTEENKDLMIMIATEGSFINLYKEVNLKWSMKVDLIPVSIRRVFISSLPGGIVLLSEDGLLQVVYIGTHPSVYLVPQLVQPEIDIQSAESQLQQLQQKIAENDVEDPLTADPIAVNLKIEKTASTHSDSKICNIALELSVVCLISKIRVLFTVEPPLSLKIQSITILDCHEDTLIENSVYVNGPGVISNLTLQTIVTYVTSEGVVRCVQKCGALPLDLVVTETTPMKEAQHKVTITTNKSVCDMNKLFRELTSESTCGAIGLQFNSGDVVSILAAKSSQRYRLQSDSLAAITLILQAFLQRLKTHFQKDPDFSVIYSAPLPLDEFFEKIIIHHGLIQKQKILEETLSKQTSQYIAIQKKVLAKLKDVSPKVAFNLCNILKDTSKMIENSIEELEVIENDLYSSRSVLSSMCRLMIALLDLMSVRKEDFKFLKAAFNPDIQDTDDQGWLEVQEAAISFLLRTILAKSIKDQQMPVDVALERLTDVSKLTKHFTSAIERLTKGTFLLERNDYERKKEPLVTIQAAYESDESLFDDVIPTSTKLLSGDSRKHKVISKSEGGIESLAAVREDEEEKGECSKTTADTVSRQDEITAKTQSNPPLQKETDFENKKGKESEEQDEDDGIWDVNVMEMRI